MLALINGSVDGYGHMLNTGSLEGHRVGVMDIWVAPILEMLLGNHSLYLGVLPTGRLDVDAADVAN